MIIAVTLSPEWAETVRLGLALLVPIAVGLLTKSNASPGLKSTINVVLAAFVTAVTTILDQADANVAVVTRAFILTAVSSFASYYGIWKPTGIAGSLAARTPDFGIGSPPAPTLTTEDKGLEDVQVAPAVMEEITERVDDGATVPEAVIDTLPDAAVPDGTVQEVLDWVNGDLVRARAAVDVEQQRDRPRIGVLQPLRDLLGT